MKEPTDVELPVTLDRKRIEAFCRKWRITEFSLFGSVLQPSEFSPTSDIDVLVRYAPEAQWSLFDEVEMEDELRRWGRPPCSPGWGWDWGWGCTAGNSARSPSRVVVRFPAYLDGVTLRYSPRCNSSTSSGHLNSRSRTFRSMRR
ncbi:MAG: nucleotidyltransferase domain-containing protein [Acidobacteria bacterium]|nr:nucleotidyltransferase domain-containing protein [Acidobacteriota bacterium]